MIRPPRSRDDPLRRLKNICLELIISIVEGRVTKVSEPRRVSGRPTIGILPEAVILPNGERVYLDATLTDTNIPGTDVNSEGQFKGSGHDREDQLEVGGGAAGGMLFGGLIGGPVGVLVGGAIGAGSTTTYWLVKHHSTFYRQAQR